MGGLIHGPFIAPYNVSKAGVVALTETLSNELAIEGSAVGVSVLCPGAVKTNMNNETNVPEERKMAARPASPAIEQLREALVAQLDNHGLGTDVVAAAVIDAIRQRKLHVLTNADLTPLLKMRFDGILGSADTKAVGLDELVEASG
jgi:short-subunit dehydrogenase